jgi:hypothetical protein
MAIDFSFPDEIEQVRHQVRKFCDEVVRPSEALIEANEGDRNESFFDLYPNIAQKAGVITTERTFAKALPGSLA